MIVFSVKIAELLIQKSIANSIVLSYHVFKKAVINYNKMQLLL